MTIPRVFCGRRLRRGRLGWYGLHSLAATFGVSSRCSAGAARGGVADDWPTALEIGYRATEGLRNSAALARRGGWGAVNWRADATGRRVEVGGVTG